MIVFVDMDEVMADAYGAHVDRYREEFGSAIALEDCVGKEFWQCIPEAHRESVRAHCHTPGFFRDLEPIEGAREVLKELDGRYTVYIASAAMEFPNSLREKSDWLDRYFPFIPWQRRILCGDKSILRGDVLIDDRTKNLDPFVGRAILFTSPHNVGLEGYERADSWAEVAKLLL